MSTRLHTPLAALAAAALVAGFSSEVSAASGQVDLKMAKAGVIIGGTSGTGTLRFRGRTYPLLINGASGGFTFGGSDAVLTGRISNIRRASDIQGPYNAASWGGAIGAGQQTITLTNQNGAVLQLNGTLTGLMVNADTGSMQIQMAGRPHR